jgi:hypothetical protein
MVETLNVSRPLVFYIANILEQCINRRIGRALEGGDKVVNSFLILRSAAFLVVCPFFEL